MEYMYIPVLLDAVSDDEFLVNIPLSPELVTPDVLGCSPSEVSSFSSSDESEFSSLSSSSSLGSGGYTAILKN